MKKKKISTRAFYQSTADKKKSRTSILLADDHLAMRRGIKGLINAEDDLFITAEACNGKEAVIFARETSPDVIVMDFNMPIMNGIEATKAIILVNPSIRIIGLSLNNHNYARQSMLKAGASAYLTKSDVFDTLCSTIRNVVNLPEGKRLKNGNEGEP